MKKIFVILIISILTLTLVFVGCNNNKPTQPNFGHFDNPGDNLGGGGAFNETVTNRDTTNIKNEINNQLDSLKDNPTIVETVGTNIYLVDGDNVIEVKNDGNFLVKGKANGQLILKNGGKNPLNINLILAGVDITSATSSPLMVFDNLNVTITLQDGTQNILEDTDTHSVYYKKSGKTSTDSSDDKVNGCLYVQNNLVINGTGSLTVKSNYKNGISAKDTVTIENGNLIIDNTADGSAIKGKDSVVIKGGNLNLTSKGDGIKTDTETDDKTIGDVLIQNATITINAKDNGICADTLLYIKSGDINITTNNGAPNTITESSASKTDGKGLKVGTLKVDYETAGITVKKEITDTSYYKLVIDGGRIVLNANDDAIHSNGYMFINGGDIDINTGDDAIHSEEFLSISNGTIDIHKCYEGIEASDIEISGGNITLISQDDGINAANSNMGRGYTFKLNITGGNISVNAKGDGLDSNGYIAISGGTVYVDGPTSNGDAAIDADKGILITGGKVVAVGSSGMVETPSSDSTQCVISYACKETIQASSTFTIIGDGKTILTFTTAKSCQSIIASIPELEKGKTYSLCINGQVLQEFTITGIITKLGTATTGGFGGGNPPPGGGGRPGWGFRG